jgi:hypothetical protein
MTEAIDAVSTQLAALEESITGITKAFAFDEMPDALSTAFLPCFTNIPNGAEYVDVSAQYGTGIVAEVRQYEATCWYKPVQAPPDMSRHAAGLQTLIEAIKVCFLNRPQLGGLCYCIRARLLGDTGPIVSAFMGGKTEYSAVGFTIEVEYLTNITYEDGD